MRYLSTFEAAEKWGTVSPARGRPLQRKQDTGRTAGREPLDHPGGREKARRCQNQEREIHQKQDKIGGRSGRWTVNFFPAICGIAYRIY